MSESNTPSETPRPRRKRNGLRVAISLFVIVLLVVAFAPSILSSGVGRGMITRVIDGKIKGSVKLGALSLSWFGGQSIGDIQLLDPDGKRVATVKSVSTELSIASAIGGELNLGKTQLSGIRVDVIVDDNGVSNLQRAIESVTPSTEPTILPATLALDLTVSDASATISAPGIEKVTFDDLTASAKWSNIREALSVKVDFNSKQGDIGGKFGADLKLTNLLTTEGHLDPSVARATGTLNAVDLPMQGVDQILGLKGLLSELTGDRMNIRLTINANDKAIESTLDANAPNLTASGAYRYAEGTLRSVKSTTIEFVEQPALMEKLIQLSNWKAGARLRRAVPLTLEIRDLVLPLKKIDLAMSSFDLELKAEEAHDLAGDSTIGDFVAKTFLLSIASKIGDEHVTVRVDSEMTLAGQEGGIHISGDIGGLWNVESQKFDAASFRPNLQIDLHRLPTPLITSLAQAPKGLAEVLGPHVTVTANVSATGADQANATITIDTPNLNAKDLEISIGKTIDIKPFKIDLKAPAVVLNPYLGTPEDIQLAGDANVHVALTEPVTVDVPDGDPPDWNGAIRKAAIAATLTIDPLRVNGLPGLGPVQLGQIAVNVSGSGEKGLKVAISGSADPMDKKLPLVSQIGPERISLELNADISLDASLNPGAVTFTLTGKTGAKSIKAEGQIAEDFSSLTVRGGEAKAHLTRDLLKSLGATEQVAQRLKQPVPVTVTLDPTTIALKDFSLAKMKTGVTILPGLFILGGDDQLAGASLSNTEIKLEFDGPTNRATVNLQANAAVPGQKAPGTLTVRATVQKPVVDGELDIAGASISGQVELKGLPSAFVDAVANREGELTRLLGPTLHITVDAVMPNGPAKAGTVNFAAKTRSLDAQIALKTGAQLTLARPASVTLKVSPGTYAEWMRSRLGADSSKPATPDANLPVEVIHEVELTLLVKSLKTPFATTPANDKTNSQNTRSTINPSDYGVNAELTIPRLTIRETATGRVTEINNLKATLTGDDFSKPVAYTVMADITPPAEPATQKLADPSADSKPPQKPQVAIKGQFGNFMTPSGEFNFNEANVVVKAHANGLPVAWVDQMAGQDGMILASLGPQFGFNIDTELTHMTGPMQVDITSTHANLHLEGISRDGAFFLTKALTIDLTVQEQLGRKVLSNLHPLLETAVSAEKPIRLTISNEGLRIPLKGFDLAKLYIASAKLELGKVSIKNEGTMGSLFGGIQKFSRQPPPRDGFVQVWFTPAVISIRDGVLVYKNRMDFLLDGSLPLATWGSRRLTGVKQLELRLGFGQKALQKWGIRNAQANDFMVIPIRGNAQSGAQIDFAAAAIDFGKLKGQNELARNNPFLGALIGDLSGKLFKTERPPAPSANPLPWHGLLQESQDEPKTNMDTNKPKPESIEEQLLNSLFDGFKKL